MKKILLSLLMGVFAVSACQAQVITNGPITVTCPANMTITGLDQEETIVTNNLVVNGNFEDGVNGWTPYLQTEFIADTTFVHGGSGSAYFSNPVSGHRSVEQYVPTIAGKDYNISAWLYIPSISPAPRAFIYLDHSGQELSSNSTDEWIKVSATFTADSSSTKVRILGEYGAPLDSFFYVDDVVVSEVPRSPFENIGVYNVIPDIDIGTIVEGGMNAVQIFDFDFNNIQSFLDEAEVQGAKAYVTVGCNADVCDTATVTTYVNAFKDHAGLGGWYLQDDANLVGASPAAILNTHNLVKSLDPNHPTVVSLAARNGTGDFDTYMNVSDSLWVWRYPIGKTIEGSIADIGADLDYIKGVNPNKDVWYTIQAFGPIWGTAWGWNATPTREETQQMVDEAYDHGADSIIFYTYASSNVMRPYIWENVKAAIQGK